MADNNETYNFLLQEAADNYKSASWQYGAGAFSKLAGAYINYQALQTERMQNKLQARQVELNSLENANMMREQLVNAYGQYISNAAARGISVGSGSVQDNLINSSVEFGKDIQTMETNAHLQASAIRANNKINKYRAVSRLASGIAGSTGDFVNSYNSYGTYRKLNSRSNNG